MNKYISQTLNLSEQAVANTLKLLSEGATIPFISRYRKEATGAHQHHRLSDSCSFESDYLKLVAFRLRLPHKHLNMDLYPGVPDHHCINSHYCHNPQLLCRF